MASAMGTDRLYNTEGIIMHRRDQGEADRVLTLCTPQGKISIIAKGARKVRSRKAGHIELFSHTHFVVSRVKNYWDIISQAETVDAHQVLREDLLLGTYARYAIELVDGFFTEGEGGPAVFDLLDHTLTWLGEENDRDLVLRFYEQHLLGLAGFRPELFACVGEREHGGETHAEDPNEARPYGLDPERGGMLCAACYEHRKREGLMSLSPQTLAFLRACQREPYTQLSRRRVSRPIHAEAERVMQHYITYHLERGIRSIAFLHQIRRQFGP